MMAFKPYQRVLTFFVCLIAIDCGFWVWAWLSPYDIANENGPLENIQVIILSLTFVAYILHFSKQENAAQCLAAVFCFVCAYLILKELDFRELIHPVPSVGPYWVENTLLERIRKLFKLFGLLLLIVFLISRIRDIPFVVRAMITWRAWPFYLCAVFLILGQAIEPGGFRNPGGLTGPELNQAMKDFHRTQSIGKFWEELVELNAYLALLYAAQSSAVISCFINGRKKA